MMLQLTDPGDLQGLAMAVPPAARSFPTRAHTWRQPGADPSPVPFPDCWCGDSSPVGHCCSQPPAALHAPLQVSTGLPATAEGQNWGHKGIAQSGRGDGETEGLLCSSQRKPQPWKRSKEKSKGAAVQRKLRTWAGAHVPRVDSRSHRGFPCTLCPHLHTQHPAERRAPRGCSKPHRVQPHAEGAFPVASSH